MFGIGMPELLVVVGIALVIVGPKKIPDLAKSLGKGFAEFKKATQEIKNQLEIDDTIHDIKDTINDAKGDIINVSSKDELSSHTNHKVENDEIKNAKETYDEIKADKPGDNQ